MRPASVFRDIDIRLYAFDRMVCGRWWNYRRVVSPFARLYLVMDGAALVRIRSLEIPLRPGGMVLVPPFVPVDYLCNRSFDSYYALMTCRTHAGIDLLGLEGLRASVPADDLCRALFQLLHGLNPGRRLEVVDPRHPDYDRAIWSADPVQALPADAQLATDGALRVLLARFLGDTPVQERVTRFQPVVAHIQRHLHQDLGLERLAAIAGLSPNHFSHAFLAETGQRPVAFVCAQRIRRAQLLLLTTRMEVKEVARACGFLDADYFCRIFRRQVSMTPTGYRERGR